MEVLRDKRFLKKAREQLDADHFGLDKIKRRLIEYLAVVRLKALQADEEAKQIETAQKSQLALVPKDQKDQTPKPAASGAPATQPASKQSRKPVKGPILL